MNNLDYLIFHCTATPRGRKVTASDILKWHLSPPPEGRGWSKPGYSDVLYLDGELVNLTPFNQDNIVDPWEITNGALGMNLRSRHIVYVGGLDLDPQLVGGQDDDDAINDIANLVPADTRTDEQKSAMEIYAKYMILRHPLIKLAGHGDFNDTHCPSFNVHEWAKSVGINDANIYHKK